MKAKLEELEIMRSRDAKPARLQVDRTFPSVPRNPGLLGRYR